MSRSAASISGTDPSPISKPNSLSPKTSLGPVGQVWNAATGAPQAIASINTLGNPSNLDDSTKTVARDMKRYGLGSNATK